MKLTVPHYVLAVLAIYLAAAPTLDAQFPAIASVDQVFERLVPLVMGLLGWGSASAFAGVNAKAAAAKLAGSTLLLVALFALLPGCSASPPVVPQTPENAQPIADCQGIEQTRNSLVIGDIVFTGGATGAGVVAAAIPSSSDGAKTGLAVGAASAAGIAGVLTVLSALETGKYAQGQCQGYLGPLPATPFGKTKLDGGAQ